MKLPLKYALSGSSNDGNTVTAVRSDSSTKIRLDAMFSRKIATFNAGTGVYSVPTMDVVIRRDVAGADGNPVGQRASASIGFRLPVAMAGSDLDALIADLRSYVNDSDLKDNLVRQMLPSCCADDPAV